MGTRVHVVLDELVAAEREASLRVLLSFLPRISADARKQARYTGTRGQPHGHMGAITQRCDHKSTRPNMEGDHESTRPNMEGDHETTQAQAHRQTPSYSFLKWSRTSSHEGSDLSL